MFTVEKLTSGDKQTGATFLVEHKGVPVCKITISKPKGRFKSRYTSELSFSDVENSELLSTNTVEIATALQTVAIVRDFYVKDTPSIDKLNLNYCFRYSCYEWFCNYSFYVYRITADDSNKFYYGVRHLKIKNASLVDCFADSYMGSGGNSKNNKFRNWKAKHKNNLRKTVIAIFDNAANAYDLERVLVGDNYKTNKLCLNSNVGGIILGSNIRERESRYFKGNCKIHGVATHSRGGTCLRCAGKGKFSYKHCKQHKKTLHSSNGCVKCFRENAIKAKTCVNHGETLHQGNSCLKCSSKKAISFDNCKKHGFTAFRSNRCVRCSVSALTMQGECVKHGNVTVTSRGKCKRCLFENSSQLLECSVHGLTIHQGKGCAKCLVQKSLSTGVCNTHGETSFTGGTCNKCRALGLVSLQVCKIHGEVKFVGDKCRVCVNQTTVSEKFCDTHGVTKHQGTKCCKCFAMRAAHRRYHLKKPNVVNCEICRKNIKLEM